IPLKGLLGVLASSFDALATTVDLQFIALLLELPELSFCSRELSWAPGVCVRLPNGLEVLDFALSLSNAALHCVKLSRCCRELSRNFLVWPFRLEEGLLIHLVNLSNGNPDTMVADLALRFHVQDLVVANELHGRAVVKR